MATAIKTHAPRPIGKAVRFLLNRHTGLLLTDDPVTQRPNVTYIRYASDARGTLVTQIPANSPHAEALRRSEQSVLCVSTGQPGVQGPADDEDFAEPMLGISNVQAAVRTEVFDAPNPLYLGVRMRIRDVKALVLEPAEEAAAPFPVL